MCEPSVLQEKPSDFLTILSDSRLFLAVQLKSQNVILYILNNIRSILNISLKDDKSKEALNAFQILCCGNNQISNSLVTTARFFEVSTALLINESTTKCIIGRLAAITLSLFKSCDYDILYRKITPTYICMYMKNCDNLSVSSMFQTMFIPNDILTKKQLLIADHKFFEVLGQNLKLAASKFVNDDLVSTNIQEFLISFLELIKLIFQNKNLKVDNYKKDLYNTLSYLSNKIHQNPFIVNKYWECVNSLYNLQKPLETLLFTVPARELLISLSKRESEEISIHPYHAEALDFLTKYIGIRNDLIDNELITAVLSIMLQFQNCSLYMLKAKYFFTECCKDTIVLCRFAKYVIPVLVVESEINSEQECNSITDHGLISVYARSILEEIYFNQTNKIQQRIRALLKSIDGAVEFCEGNLKDYINKRDKEYGGVCIPSSMASFFFSISNESFQCSKCLY